MKLIAIVILPFSLYASACSIMGITSTLHDRKEKWSEPNMTVYHGYSTIHGMLDDGLQIESEVCGDIGKELYKIERNFKIKDRWD